MTAVSNTLAEIPFALWMPADPSNYRPRSALQIRKGVYDLIVIHITSGHAKALPVAQMWQQANVKHSGHFVVDNTDGTIYQCVPLRFAAYHAHSANDRSIGIEHCAREPNEPSFPKGDPGLAPTDVQYRQSARLVAWLLKAGGLKPVRGVTIMGHKEADPDTDHDQCPDGNWDWTVYMQYVNEEYNKIGEDDPSPMVA